MLWLDHVKGLHSAIFRGHTLRAVGSAVIAAAVLRHHPPWSLIRLAVADFTATSTTDISKATVELAATGLLSKNPSAEGSCEEEDVEMHLECSGECRVCR